MAIDPRTEASLKVMLDKQEIHEVMMRYCRAVDRMDEELPARASARAAGGYPPVAAACSSDAAAAAASGGGALPPARAFPQQRASPARVFHLRARDDGGVRRWSLIYEPFF